MESADADESRNVAAVRTKTITKTRANGTTVKGLGGWERVEPTVESPGTSFVERPCLPQRRRVVHVKRFACGLPYPHRSRDLGASIGRGRFVAAQFLTYPHGVMARDSAGIRAKGEKPPNLSPLDHSGDRLLPADWRRVKVRARFARDDQ